MSSREPAETHPAPAQDEVGSGRPPDGYHGSQEEVDEAGDETFPASDAPQWWAGDSAPDADDGER